MNLYNIDQTLAGMKPFQLYDKKWKKRRKKEVYERTQELWMIEFVKNILQEVIISSGSNL